MPNPRSEAEWIRSSSLFRSLSDDVLEKLASVAIARRYPARTVLYRRNDSGESMMVVVSGRVVISSLSPEGNEVILNLINPGEVHGEIALLDGGPRTATATADLDTEALVLQRRDVKPMLEESPGLAVQLLQVLCARIRETTAFVEDAVLMDVPRRFARRLDVLATRYGEPTDGGGQHIRHGLSQQELAEATGITRVSVNKMLMSWQREGLLEHGRGYVTVHDWEALRTFVDGDA
ncbi:MAG: Crp/Fnr family transcriptional regulator [Myxococcota bacterium]